MKIKESGNVTDLNLYKYESYLKVCLGLIREAYEDLEDGHGDLAKEQLLDILETFDQQDGLVENDDHIKNVIPFIAR